MRFTRKPRDRKIDRQSERQKEIERKGEGDSEALHKLRSCKCPEISVIHFHFPLTAGNISATPPSLFPPPFTMHFQFSNFKRSTGRMINFIYLKANVQRACHNSTAY